MFQNFGLFQSNVTFFLWYNFSGGEPIPGFPSNRPLINKYGYSSNYNKLCLSITVILKYYYYVNIE